MNKDTIIGFALIALVLIGYSWYSQPSAEQIEAARQQDSIAAVTKEKAEKARLAKVQRDKEIQDSIAKSRAKENELEEINNMPNQSKAYRKRTGSTTNK